MIELKLYLHYLMKLYSFWYGIHSSNSIRTIFTFVASQTRSNRIGGVMVLVLSSSTVDRGFEPRSGKTKDYKIGICCFFAKHAVLRRTSKDWLARNQDNVSEWSDRSIRGLWAGTIQIQLVCYKVGIIIISLKINLFSWTNCWVDVKQQSLTHSNEELLYTCILLVDIYFIFPYLIDSIQFNPTTFYRNVCTKPWKWEFMYVCWMSPVCLCFYG